MTAVASARPPRRARHRRKSAPTNQLPTHLTTYAEATLWLQEHYNLEQHLGGSAAEPPSLQRMHALMGMLGNPNVKSQRYTSPELTVKAAPHECWLGS